MMLEALSLYLGCHSPRNTPDRFADRPPPARALQPQPCFGEDHVSGLGASAYYIYLFFILFFFNEDGIFFPVVDGICGIGVQGLLFPLGVNSIEFRSFHSLWSSNAPKCSRDVLGINCFAVLYVLIG